MNFALPAGALANVIGVVKGCIPGRSTIPILNHVLIEALAGKVTVRASNLDMEAVATSQADVAADGIVALPGDIMHGIVKRMPKTDLVTITMEGPKALIKSRRSNYEIRALPPDDFPVRHDNGSTREFAMPAATLINMLRTTLYAMGTDESRFYLKGVHMFEETGRLVTVAADGHRCGKMACALPDGATGMPGVIVPAEAVRQVVAMFDGVDGDAVVGVSDVRIKIVVGDFTFSSQLLDSKYPEFDQLISQASTLAATVRPRALGEALDRAFVVYSGTDVKAPAARMTMGAKGIDLVAGSQASDLGTEDVEATVHERGCEIKVNARYLAEMLKQWGDVDVNILAGGPAGPITFVSPDVPDALHLIMRMA